MRLSLYMLCSLSLCIAAYIVYRRRYSSLAGYPGPFLASITDIWRLFYSIQRRHHEPLIDIHNRYGNVVRLGPNFLSFATPKACSDIYGSGKNFAKSPFYSVITPNSKGVLRPTMFSTTDLEYHGRYRRTVNSAYSMSSILQFERYFDETIDILIRRLDERQEKIVNVPQLLQYYAFDVVGMLAYSKSYGFLEEMADVGDIIKTTRFILDYTSHMGNLPILDWLMFKNPFMLWLGRIGLFDMTTPLVPFANRSQQAKLATRASEKKPAAPQDLMDKYLDIHEAKPESLTLEGVTELGIMMGFAGSESTAGTISALLYNITSRPLVYKRLLGELDSSLPEKTKHIPYTLAQNLPYLDACIMENLRLRPAGGYVFERITPTEGAMIDGHAVPGNTIVGCSSWPVHRNATIFGSDINQFVPERWLDEDKVKVANMKKAMFHFGGMPHDCLGKNISIIEIFKVASTLLRLFEMELVHPEEKPKITVSQFVRMEYLMRLHRRV